MSDEARTLDYRNPVRIWGHDITIRPIDGGNEISGCLWSGTGLHVGDYLLLTNGAGESRYRVTKADPMRDPGDMYAYRATFAPRQEGDRG